MKEIASAISEGAHAFLTAEYKILVIFVIVLFVLIGLGIGFGSGVAFVFGTLCSILAGYFGMGVATKANVRTANAARTSGMNRALSIAFSGGAVMGMCVVGLGVLGGKHRLYRYKRHEHPLWLQPWSIFGCPFLTCWRRYLYKGCRRWSRHLVGKVEAGIPRTTLVTPPLSPIT